MNQNTETAQTESTGADSADAAAAVAEVEKTRIRPDLNRYVRDKSGKGKRTHRTDDFVARTLAGKEVEAIKEGALALGIDVAKWQALNPGQQRMLIGNAMRHLMNDSKNPLSEDAVAQVFGPPCAPYDAEAAAAAEAQAKADKEAKAAAKKAAEAAATPAPAAAEGSGEQLSDKLPSGKPRPAKAK